MVNKDFHIHSINRNKSPLQISGKVAVNVLRDSWNFFTACIYRVHRTVISVFLCK